MAGRWSDEHIAASLNRMGIPTGQGKTWTAKRVSSVRRVQGNSCLSFGRKKWRMADDVGSRHCAKRNKPRHPAPDQSKYPSCCSGCAGRALPNPRLRSGDRCCKSCDRPKGAPVSGLRRKHTSFVCKHLKRSCTMNHASRSAAWSARRCWNRSQCGRHRGSGSARPSGRGNSGLLGRSPICPRLRPAWPGTRRSGPRPAAWSFAVERQPGSRRWSHGSMLQSHRTPLSAGAPQRRSRWGAFDDVNKFTAAMGPTMCERDRPAGALEVAERLVSAIAVRLQHAGEAVQQRDSMVVPAPRCVGIDNRRRKGPAPRRSSRASVQK